MKIVLVGSGGREDAFIHTLALSTSVAKIYVLPGNEGMRGREKVELVEVGSDDLDEIVKIIKKISPDLTIVGPEKYLELGITNRLQALNLRVFAPTKDAAQLECSKSFAKEFMHKYKIPTARHWVFEDLIEVEKFLNNWSWENGGVAIKVDGLAAGKGVVMARTIEIAKNAAFDFLSNPNSEVKSKKILIEEELIGDELSAFAICDGEKFVTFGFAKDHKRIFDNDMGPNTGGMGSFSLPDRPNLELKKMIEEQIFKPVVLGMKNENNPFVGFLFAGLMIQNNLAKVIEFNVRMGDPECQVILPRFKGDLAQLLYAATEGKVEKVKWELDDLVALHVVMTSHGYPSSKLQTGEKIIISNEMSDFLVFYSGVRRNSNDDLINSSGRVLGVTALGENLIDVQKAVYKGIGKIKFNGAHWRKDIGKKEY